MYRKKAISFALLCILYYRVYAAYDLFFVGANSSAMSHATVMRYDIWSAFHNQAGLAHLTGISAGVYHESRFMLKELGVQAFVFSLPTESGNFATTFGNYGYSKYAEQKLGLAYAKSFGERFSAGIQIDYLRTFIAEYDEVSIFTFETGIISEPMDNFFIGAHVFNPAPVLNNSSRKEKVPAVFRLGAGYTMYDLLFISIEAEKEMEENTRLKAGLEWKMIKSLFLRTGISSHPFNTSFGLGYKYRKFSTDLAFSYHPVLGATPHFSISYGL